VRDLFFIAHRVSSPRFYAKESTLRKFFNVDRKTLRAALNVLKSVGLLQAREGKRGGPWEFWLFNPTTGLLLPEQDGRATPTYNGVLKGKGAQTAAIPERVPSAKRSREQATRTAPAQPTVAAGWKGCDPQIATAQTQVPANPKHLCDIPGHEAIHYRTDGSPLCGDCHPTGITVPPSTGFSEPHKSPMPLTPPTAEELGFSSR
jgi:Bacterial regulatory proteins, gntR family